MALHMPSSSRPVRVRTVRDHPAPRLPSQAFRYAWHARGGAGSHSKQALHVASCAPSSATSAVITTDAPSLPTPCPSPDTPQTVTASTSTSSSSSSPPQPQQPQQPQEYEQVYTSPQGTWRVRPFRNADAETVAALQTDSFHERNPIQLVDNLAYRFFYAEVIDAMRKKTQQLDPESFVMFVAEDMGSSESGSSETSSSSSSSSSQPKVVGIIEVSLSTSKDMVKASGSSQVCVYVASMAVAPSHRRRGVASSLLAAAEQQARGWHQSCMALQVFADNENAISLYTRSGYTEVYRDPMLRRLLGERIRVTMTRKLQPAAPPDTQQQLQPDLMMVSPSA